MTSHHIRQENKTELFLLSRHHKNNSSHTIYIISFEPYLIGKNISLYINSSKKCIFAKT